MQLKKLDPSFYQDNHHLQEALDNTNGNWTAGKVRGYGVVIISLNGLTFAIPLRTNIRHDAAYITVRSSQPGIKGKGLDYSKALLIHQAHYISNAPFKISPDEHKAIQSKEHFIQQRFEKYVQKYIKAKTNNDSNILGSFEYRYTTLINYHSELNLTP